ncbi:MATE family efflux transporter [Novosphingobium sp.]|uniref:MATE family efflux transporter n=1 Tax=Novosphingobium sp. TaxID=1874826 RepID=UPI0025FE1B55|nr:MATE family efflux transporter [Novosphingobium sp.]
MDAPTTFPDADTAPQPPRRGDLTSGPIRRTLLLFALPTLMGNVLQSLNASINTVWIGRLLGEAALTATANCNIVMFLVFAAVFGLSMATTVRVGQSFGARNIDAARRSFGTGVGLCLIVSLVVALLGWALAPQLLALLRPPAESQVLALTYLRVIFLVIPGMTLTVMISMGMRGSGDARTPLYFQILTAVLDVALNPLLIAGIGPFPQLGIAGAAVATAIATSIGLGGMIGWIYWRDLPLRLRGRELRYLIPAREELRFIVGKGLPMGAQMLVISGAGLIFIGLVNREGLVTAAAYGALLQIWNYIQMPSLAIGAAVSAMVAQHIGARREDRVDRIGIDGAMVNLAMTGVLVALLLAFDTPALELFLGSGSPSVAVARHIQWLSIWSYLPFGVTIVLFGTLRAYGVVMTPIVVLLASMYAVRLGFYWLAYPAMGTDALWLSFVAGSAASLALTLYAYRRGTWRKTMAARIQPI